MLDNICLSFLHIFSKGNKIVSVWGGVLDYVFVPRIHGLHKKPRNRFLNRQPDVVAVLITGSIQTWSTVLEKKCNTEECVEARLKSFKDKVKLKKHSIGFMFVCVARRCETNVESTIFKRLFPKVPLVGCYSFGEFGKTTIIDEVKESE